ncbi:hypothetical protein ACLOJK_030854 [Asimina triloba]
MDQKKPNKISEIVRLQQILKKWKKLANTPKPSCGGGSKSMKFLKRTLSLTDSSSSASSLSSGGCSDVGAVPKGFLAVSVGEEMKRFVIPTEYLSHRAFSLLLREAEEEFGFQQEGVLRIPCEVPVFERILKVVEQKMEVFFVQELVLGGEDMDTEVTYLSSEPSKICFVSFKPLQACHVALQHRVPQDRRFALRNLSHVVGPGELGHCQDPAVPKFTGIAFGLSSSGLLLRSNCPFGRVKENVVPGGEGYSIVKSSNSKAKENIVSSREGESIVKSSSGRANENVVLSGEGESVAKSSSGRVKGNVIPGRGGEVPFLPSISVHHPHPRSVVLIRVSLLIAVQGGSSWQFVQGLRGKGSIGRAVQTMMLCCEPLVDSNASTRSSHSAIVDFLRLIYGSSFALSFWPPSYPLELISSFLVDLFGYIAGTDDNNLIFASASGPIVAEIIIAAVLRHNDDPTGFAKAFISAISKNCPLTAPDANNLIGCLLDEFVVVGEVSTSVLGVSGSSMSSSLPGLVAQSEASSLSSPHVQMNANSSPVSEMSVTSSPSGVAVRSGSKGKWEYRKSSTNDDGGSVSSAAKSSVGNGSVARRSSLDQFGGPHGGLGDGAAALKQNVALFEEESLSVDGLEKQEIAFRLFVHVLEKVSVKAGHLEKIRMVATKMLMHNANKVLFCSLWTKANTDKEVASHGRVAFCGAFACCVMSLLHKAPSVLLPDN